MPGHLHRIGFWKAVVRVREMEGVIVTRVMAVLVTMLVSWMDLTERVYKESICTDSSWIRDLLKNSTPIHNIIKDTRG